jgi:hypothetical protein
MKSSEIYPRESVGIPPEVYPPQAGGQAVAETFLGVRPLAGLCVMVVNVPPGMGLWKGCTASVPDFAVQMYRKVPQSTAKRVKKIRSESVADCRKVITIMMIQKVDEVPKKRFVRNAPQNPAFKKAC